MRGRIEEFFRRILRRPPPLPPHLAARKPCCQESDNLVRSLYGADRIMDMCRVCGGRHFRMMARPGKLTGEIKPLRRR